MGCFLYLMMVCSLSQQVRNVSVSTHNDDIIKIVFIHVENIFVLESEIFYRNVASNKIINILR